jgi:hypothetical protein
MYMTLRILFRLSLPWSVEGLERIAFTQAVQGSCREASIVEGEQTV